MQVRAARAARAARAVRAVHAFRTWCCGHRARVARSWKPACPPWETPAIARVLNLHLFVASMRFCNDEAMWQYGGRRCHHTTAAMHPLSHGSRLMMAKWKDGVQTSRGGSAASFWRAGGLVGSTRGTESQFSGRMGSDLK